MPGQIQSTVNASLVAAAGAKKLAEPQGLSQEESLKVQQKLLKTDDNIGKLNDKLKEAKAVKKLANAGKETDVYDYDPATGKASSSDIYASSDKELKSKIRYNKKKSQGAILQLQKQLEIQMQYREFFSKQLGGIKK